MRKWKKILALFLLTAFALGCFEDAGSAIGIVEDHNRLSGLKGSFSAANLLGDWNQQSILPDRMSRFQKGRGNRDYAAKQGFARYGTWESWLQNDVDNYELAEVGDLIRFGNYIQGERADEIEWIVLDRDEEGILVLSRYGLDVKRYNDTTEIITWADCTLREWLNTSFFQSAFSREERSRIRLTEVSNPDNPQFRTEGGRITYDYVFCLSIDEAFRYFDSDRDRACKPTKYAISQDVDVNPHNGNCLWWLRSPGYASKFAAAVPNNPKENGSVDISGNYVNYHYSAVRPALWIQFE